MNSSSSLRFLRPYLHGESAVSTRSAWIRFFNTTRCLQSEESRPQAKHKDKQTFRTESSSSFQVQERTRELRRTGALEWPRIMNDAQVVTLRDLTSKLIDIEAAEAMKDDVFTVRGRFYN
jgi:lysyl-tRNA synthetase class 2